MSAQERFAAIRARLAAATPGPWTWNPEWSDLSGPNGFGLIHFRTEEWANDADGELAANAPADLEYLLNVLEQLEKDTNPLGLIQVQTIPERLTTLQATLRSAWAEKDRLLARVAHLEAELAKERAA